MREITFTLPGFPQLSIYAREMDDGTLALDFTVAAGSAASLQGIYLNSLWESNVVISGSDITGETYSSSIAGPGTNVKGGNGLNSGFDFGLAIGNPGRGHGIVQDTSIVLASRDGAPLTLDSLSHELLGVRLQGAGNAGPKHVIVMPAAPDAHDDSGDAVEDTPFTIDAVSNDTDADGNALTIVGVTGVDHGSVAIVDNQLVFTPDQHWSGVETFTYRISDGTGGFDTAHVTLNVDAVADATELSTAVSTGVGSDGTADVHEIVVDISSALVDTDGSETYALKVSGLPSGVTLVGDGVSFRDGAYWIDNPDGTDQIRLHLQDGASYDFDLRIDAISTEATHAGNWNTANDTAVSTQHVNVDVDFSSHQQTVSFDAVDQSQWTTGTEFTFDDERFIGVDTAGSGGFSILDGVIFGSGEWDLRVGLQSDLHFGGGEVDATVPWDLSVDSTFNRTTDVLQIDTGAALASGGSFSTDGPELTYALDFIFDVFLKASAGIDIDIYEGTFFDRTFIDVDTSANIIDFDSDTSPSIGYDFPYGISATLTWPNLEVSGSQDALGQYSGSGASNNFLDLNLDVDELIVQVLNKLGVPVPPMDLGFDILDGVAYANLSLLDADLFTGLNFLQDFLLKAGSLDAELVFEDGTRQAFTFGDTFVFENASGMDVDGNGEVEFTIDMDLVHSMFSNDTALGFNAGWNFDLLSGEAGYDIEISSGSEGFGPLLDLGDSYPIASVSVYDTTFELNFDRETYSFFA